MYNMLQDSEIQIDFCWTLSYLVDTTDEGAGSNAVAVQSIIDYDLLAPLLQLLTNPDSKHYLHLPALKAIGGMLQSTVVHKQYLLDTDVLLVIKRFLGNLSYYIY